MAKNTTANIAHTLVMNLAVNPLGESTWTAAWKRTAQKFQQNWIKMWFIFIETKKIVLLFTCPHQPSHTELLTQYLEIDALSMIVNQMKLVILEKKVPTNILTWLLIEYDTRKMVFHFAIDSVINTLAQNEKWFSLLLTNMYGIMKTDKVRLFAMIISYRNRLVTAIQTGIS